MNKYGNKKITVDGMTFDSKREYWRWCELKLLEKAGAITKLKRQVSFPLIPAYYETITDKRTGKQKRRCVERECRYIADFVYIENGEEVVEDTKGERTKEYIIKRKLMLSVHGIRIKEV